MDFRLSRAIIRIGEFGGNHRSVFCLPSIEPCFLFQEHDRVQPRPIPNRRCSIVARSSRIAPFFRFSTERQVVYAAGNKLTSIRRDSS